MTTLTLSATEARNQFFSLLDRIARGEIKVLVKKMDTKIEVLMGKFETKESKLVEVANKTYGLLKDVSKDEFGLDKTKAKEFMNQMRKKTW
ncbi:MAG: hypothetical protein ABIJ43_02835 [Candidatus Beckwithbacteria bacterium]|nr:hypothetical protein [Patescibacteria group bacterium]